MLRPSALVCVTGLAVAGAAQGEAGSAASNLVGCWRKEGIAEMAGKRGRAGWDFCFTENGELNTLTWNWEEGLGKRGFYRVRDDVLTMHGDPGEGWPSRSQSTQCRFAVNHARDELSLRDCDFQGAWKRCLKTLPREVGSGCAE